MNDTDIELYNIRMCECAYYNFSIRKYIYYTCIYLFVYRIHVCMWADRDQKCATRSIACRSKTRCCTSQNGTFVQRFRVISSGSLFDEELAWPAPLGCQVFFVARIHSLVYHTPIDLSFHVRQRVEVEPF